MIDIETKRLILRRWKEEDRTPFAQMNADPLVMKFFPKTLTTEESNASFDRIQQHFADHNYGLWAVEIKNITDFAGFIGFQIPRFEAHFTPCVEIGWRLAAQHWGEGYATEGASACLNYGFDTLGFHEVISMTATINKRSERVMQRIGMTHDPMEDFDHPRVDPESPLCRHVLYRIQRRHTS
ncbi:UNVERIFIED_CONTAM: hypothetical protein GTU68_006392 [Idotea baltica]|nr:hypothetical protein [Idotea baltica]